MEIADIRTEYRLSSLDLTDLSKDPFEQFSLWWEQALHSQIEEINAMTLATVGENGLPTARIVLLKDYSKEGFTFFTNYNSEKGLEISHNPNVAIVFFWKELQRQVRICGKAEKVSPSVSDRYFYSRPAASRIGAWSSPQSNIIASRDILEQNEKIYTEKFGQEIPRPDHWGGYLIKPTQIEFWQGRPSRLHDRFLYTRLLKDDWKIERLAP